MCCMFARLGLNFSHGRGGQDPKRRVLSQPQPSAVRQGKLRQQLLQHQLLRQARLLEPVELAVVTRRHQLRHSRIRSNVLNHGSRRYAGHNRRRSSSHVVSTNFESVLACALCLLIGMQSWPSSNRFTGNADTCARGAPNVVPAVADTVPSIKPHP